MSSIARRSNFPASGDLYSPYLVVFDSWAGEGSTRYARTISQIDLANEHLARLKSFISEQGLEEVVRCVAEPTVLGAIGVVATAEAAQTLGTMDGVVRVVRSR